MTESLQQLRGGNGGLAHEDIGDAGGEQRYSHAASSPCYPQRSPKRQLLSNANSLLYRPASSARLDAALQELELTLPISGSWHSGYF